MNLSSAIGLTLWVSAGAVFAQDAVTTLAGSPLTNGVADGTGTNASFFNPAAIVTDGGGNYFIADSGNDVIRKVTTNGVVTVFAGKPGVPGSANGGAKAAEFSTPTGLALDRNGSLYVTDTGNDTIRKITASGTVSTLAGTAATAGYQDGATGSALFNSSLGIAVWTNGDIFVADSGNHCIRKISGGKVSTFAGQPQVWGSADGNGTNAQFNGPCGLAFDARENLFVSDANNNTIREVTTNGDVTTFAGVAGADGAADGLPPAARFRSPAELIFDPPGNLFVADSFNQTIRKISTNGVVSTVSGLADSSGSQDGVNGVARFFNPYGLAIARNGSLIVADSYNGTVRVVLVPFQVALHWNGATQITTISWDAVIGKTYQVQVREGLNREWSNLGSPLAATGLNLSVVDQFSGGTKFYRIVMLL